MDEKKEFDAFSDAETIQAADGLLKLLRNLAPDVPEEDECVLGAVFASELLDADFSRYVGEKRMVTDYLRSLGQPLAKRVEAAMYAGRELAGYNLASRREEEVREQAREVYDYVFLNTSEDCSEYGITEKRWSCVCDYLEAYLDSAKPQDGVL